MNIQECTQLIDLFNGLNSFLLFSVFLFSFWLGSSCTELVIRARYELRHWTQRKLRKIRDDRLKKLASGDIK